MLLYDPIYDDDTNNNYYHKHHHDDDKPGTGGNQLVYDSPNQLANTTNTSTDDDVLIPRST